jgi:hypothetical protein
MFEAAWPGIVTGNLTGIVTGQVVFPASQRR